MNCKKNKLNLHVASNEDGLYFWDRVKPETIKKWILFLMVFMAILPIIISLTVRPWIYALKGLDAARNCDYMVANNFWYAWVYVIAAFLSVCVLLGFRQKYRGFSLKSAASMKWVRSHWLSINLVLLLGWSLISYCFAADKDSALWGDYYCHEGIFLYILYAFLFLAGSWMQEKHMRLLSEFMVGTCALTGVMVLGIQLEILPKIFYVEQEKAVMFHQYNHYGYYLGICSPLAVGLVLNDKKKNIWFRLMRFLELWLIFNALAVNSARGSFLAVLFTLACWTVYVMVCRKESVKKMILIDLLFLCTILFFNSDSTLLQRFATNVQGMQEDADKQNALDRVGSGRLSLWKWGIGFACEKPLFGYGPANLMESYTAVESWTSSPHNDLVLIAASLGFPALLFYLSGIIGHTVGFFRFVKNMSFLEVMIYSAVCSYFMGSMVGVSIYYTAPYYFFLLGCSYGIYRRHCREAQHQTAEI